MDKNLIFSNKMNCIVVERDFYEAKNKCGV